jgi:hypothetical protein
VSAEPGAGHFFAFSERRISIFSVSDYNGYVSGNQGVLCWGAPAIFIKEFDRDAKTSWRYFHWIDNFVASDVDPRALVGLHFSQLALEYESGNTCRSSGDGSEYGGYRDNYYRYSFAFAVLTIFGIACLIIGIYCILYSDKTLVIGVLLEFIGGVMFLSGVSSLIGYVATHGG